MKIDEMEIEVEDILREIEDREEVFDEYWDGRFEYQFESLTERGSRFKSIMPFK